MAIKTIMQVDYTTGQMEPVAVDLARSATTRCNHCGNYNETAELERWLQFCHDCANLGPGIHGCPWCCHHPMCVVGGQPHTIPSRRGGAGHKCTACGGCPTHCVCVKCVDCGDLIPSGTKLCQREPRCKENPHHAPYCCPYDPGKLRDDKVTFVKRPPLFLDGPACEDLRSQRYLAVEFELNRCDKKHIPRLNTLFLKWGNSVVFDGSLRNAPRETPDQTASFEVNTSPARGREFITQITELCEAFQASHALVTGQCGTHVHVDGRDFSMRDVRNMIVLYSTIEPALFAMLPADRRFSQYTPASRTFLMNIVKGSGRRGTPSAVSKSSFDAFRRNLSMALYGHEDPTTYASRKGHDGYGHRNMAFNVHSWMHRKTFEFRHFPGSIDQAELIPWAALLATLVDFVKSTSEAAINSLTGSPVDILGEIAASAPSLGVLDFVEKRLDTMAPDFAAYWAEPQAAKAARFRPKANREYPRMTKQAGLREYDEKEWTRTTNQWGHMLYVTRASHKGHPRVCTPDDCKAVRWPTTKDFPYGPPDDDVSIFDDPNMPPPRRPARGLADLDLSVGNVFAQPLVTATEVGRMRIRNEQRERLRRVVVDHIGQETPTITEEAAQPEAVPVTSQVTSTTVGAFDLDAAIFNGDDDDETADDINF